MFDPVSARSCARSGRDAEVGQLRRRVDDARAAGGFGHLEQARPVGDEFADGLAQALRREIAFLNELRAVMPPGIVELSKVPGLSVKKIESLRSTLGISSVDELRAAAEAGKVRHVPGFGAKTEQGILNAIKAISEDENSEQRIHIHHALRAGEQILPIRLGARVLEVSSS